MGTCPVDVDVEKNRLSHDGSVLFPGFCSETVLIAPRDRLIGSAYLRYDDGNVDCGFPGCRGTWSVNPLIELCGSKG